MIARELATSPIGARPVPHIRAVDAQNRRRASERIADACSNRAGMVSGRLTVLGFFTAQPPGGRVDRI